MRRIFLFSSIVCIGCILYAVYSCRSSSSSQSAAEKIPDSISYSFNIRPILSDKCFKCHGPDANKRQAGLRLDVPEGAYAAFKDNPQLHALVPGSLERSALYQRVCTEDTAALMPPPSSNLKRLNASEIALIKKWIKQGAKYPIDNFILHKLEEKGLKPNPEADKERLLKRLCFDLTGLPPDLETMDKFMSDASPDAYEKTTDELMSRPAYGEKMALHWLDAARYADSHGFQDDNYRSQWPWRDWVIHAYNKNLSYKDFVTWQLSGDLLPNHTKEQLLATGFNRNHKITEEGGVIDEEYRIGYVTDRTDTFGKSMIGVSLECARCHDHKYDPFSQKEYYQVFSFFNHVKEVGIESIVGGPATYAKKPVMYISNEDVQSLLKFVNKQDTNKLMVSVMGDDSISFRKTYLLKRGVYDAPGDEVSSGTPKSILPFNSSYPKNRLGLSQWLFDKENPLTARVYVNRIWQEFFGRGIVKTVADFGMQGDMPSHRELLDWLAVDFREHGWNVKRLVKQIVTSATYRQSAAIPSEKLKTDPENIWLARGPRCRLPAEFVRDELLASSGLLTQTVGGPSVTPYQPPGLWEGATSGRGLLSRYRQSHGASLYRRGMYTLIKRTVPPVEMGLFDASSRDQCEGQRQRTNTPLQALMMLNNPMVWEASRVLAAKLLRENTSPNDKIHKAFRLIICRKPTEKEMAILSSLYFEQLKSIDKTDADKLLSIGEYPVPAGLDRVTLAAMMQVMNAIYNLEEAITKT